MRNNNYHRIFFLQPPRATSSTADVSSATAYENISSTDKEKVYASLKQGPGVSESEKNVLLKSDKDTDGTCNACIAVEV